MKIKILELIDGAKKAEGLTVIIDVFRAFTLETYLFGQGAEKIYPVGDMEEAFALKSGHPDWLLFGERGGAKVEGCDFGNSPSAIQNMDFTGRTIIHSTSAGTQGIINAVNADEILVAGLTNARAVAEYILTKKP
ncbi:MAG: 2-phosphosulfolactate phosphatase, partial [Mogibacterium sp.]|nr:2-phosphosulfolactate phosphatase [Mogibacterium sp.]